MNKSYNIWLETNPVLACLRCYFGKAVKSFWEVMAKTPCNIYLNIGNQLWKHLQRRNVSNIKPLAEKKKNYWNVQQSHTGKKQANAIVIHWQHHVEVFSRILWRLSLNEKKSLAEKVQCSKEKKALGFKLFDWWYLKYYNSSQKCHPRSLVNLPCFIFYIYFIATIRDDTKTQTTIAFVWDNTMLLLYHQCCCERAKEKKKPKNLFSFLFQNCEKRDNSSPLCVLRFTATVPECV